MIALTDCTPYHARQMNTEADTIGENPANETEEDSLLSIADALRARCFATVSTRHQKEFGQFLTPPHVADLMAAMFDVRSAQVRLLDAGAGMGMLSAAFVRRQLQRKTPPKRIEVTAYELDSRLVQGIEQTYDACRFACQKRGVGFLATIRNTDFIAEAAEMQRRDLFSTTQPFFDAAIVNPPYGKLSAKSEGYRLLRAVSAETTNLYTAFLNLIIGLLHPKGELVAITPRSFCNGPYFKPFRQRFFKDMSLRRIHVFESRTAAFKHDNVLQENIVLRAVKDAKACRTIRVSQSGGGVEDAIRSRTFRAAEIVSPTDTETFIHIPTCKAHLAARAQIARLEGTLARLGLTVSTGRVVDFRARDHIRQQPETGTCPLIYPCHFNGLFVSWPAHRDRKPNAIRDNAQTQNLVVPAAVYVLTKRFTSKEERRRVVACIYDPNRIGAKQVGFENHLNYIHADGKGLDMLLAKGLWAYLNSSALDLYFRQFNGHTQVNATDLRNVRFPTEPQLRAIGSHVGDMGMEQDEVDRIVMKETTA
ncbi:MAG: Eco57I restriction-modification methylase domain-containing protein [Kiritimatiellia bacterium]|nr:Eco57I restriction-modification methylase domain-containing protein [Kiritimatiellia bacterium]